MLFLIATAWACDPAISLENLRRSAFREDYLCVARAADPQVLAAAVAAEPNMESRDRLSRALCLWLLEHGDSPIDRSLLPALNPADRRLLEDGIHARRGRKTPAEVHQKVFEQLGFPPADARYTDGKLLPVDLENLKALREIPPPVAAPAAAPEVPDVLPPPPPKADPGWWSCSSAGGPAGPASFLLALSLLRRRKSLVRSAGS
ncbi:MAG TPA: hypothetical protein PKY30_22315 [Myxococcota bacterium]|nr:hypothetical protein [Myxococcota bacterium]